eukprot:11961940-Alexandrium_andersonii.AAC.1
MSASLVGSEMCIRDSLWMRAWFRYLGLAPKGLRLACAVRFGTNLARLSGCLLYTSDAADDM